MQAVTTGAYRAVEFIKKNLNLNKDTADIEDSKKVVKICTQYAQKGMRNIFAVIFSLTLAFAYEKSVKCLAAIVSSPKRLFSAALKSKASKAGGVFMRFAYRTYLSKSIAVTLPLLIVNHSYFVRSSPFEAANSAECVT